MRRRFTPAPPQTRVTPEPIVPVRALDWPDVRGQRVLIGHAGAGWRGDLRADAPVTQNDRTYVPVLLELDWYRAEAEQTEAFAPLIPADRVWVETLGSGEAAAPAGSPDVRHPVPAVEASAVSGHRVVLAAEGRLAVFRRDLRAVTEVRESPTGGAVVLVVEELDWYRWAWTGRTPRALEVAADRLWLE